MTLAVLIDRVIINTSFISKKQLCLTSVTRQMSNCIFCKIITGDAPGEILYEDDEIAIFKDVKPASKFHVLAIPKQHIANINSLTKDHMQLVNKLTDYSKQLLNEKGGDLKDVLLGFHLPPFNSVPHLHLHAISPASAMNVISRLIFKPHTWWFSSVDQILDKLDKSKL